MVAKYSVIQKHLNFHSSTYTVTVTFSGISFNQKNGPHLARVLHRKAREGYFVWILFLGSHSPVKQ